MEKQEISCDRPEWDTLFMSLAFLVSQRSPDSETKIGCILVDKSRRILSLGFNGFPRGCNDEKLPNTRPEKYFYVIHAESNCLINANVIPEPEKCTMYITAKPCHECLKLIIQYGIGHVVYSGVKAVTNNDEDIDKIDRMLAGIPIELRGFGEKESIALKSKMKNLLSNTISYIDYRC